MFSQVLLKAIVSSALVLPCKCSLEFFFYPMLGTLEAEFCQDKAGWGLSSLDPQTLITAQGRASVMLYGLC